MAAEGLPSKAGEALQPKPAEREAPAGAEAAGAPKQGPAGQAAQSPPSFPAVSASETAAKASVLEKETPLVQTGRDEASAPPKAAGEIKKPETEVSPVEGEEGPFSEKTKAKREEERKGGKTPDFERPAAAPVSQPQTPEEKPAPPDVGAAVQEAEEVFDEPTTPVTYGATSAYTEEAESIRPPIMEDMKTTEPPYAEEAEPEAPAHAPEPPPGPQYAPMYVVQITPELAPLAKVGGLADVVMGLSRELELRGNAVEIILPKYDCMRYDHIWGLCKSFDDLWVPWYGGHIHCTVWFGMVHGRKCFFIEPHSQDNFFNRGSIYGFDDDILRFAFFSRAAIEFLWKAGKHPDVIHCHDWQTALVPVFLYEVYQHMGMRHPRVCFTIHNFKHQGVTGDFVLNATGLNRPEYYLHSDRLLDNHIPHALNIMKGGVVYSNFVSTVSPRYAGETKDGGQGFGLEPTLHAHHYKYGGIVNGIDYDVWNPEIDPYIPAHYNIDNIDEKYANKRALRHRLMLADNEKPIIAFIGRLDPQKGLDLLRHALFYSLNNGAQFVLLGSGAERDINNYFWELKRHLNDSPDCHIEVGFDEELAHLIYAGADMIIVPSLFEPCGLTQLIAMKYGTIPIVRSIGGLADTVFDKDNAHDKPLHERNGYVFRDYNNAGIESALSRAIACYYQFPGDFRELMKNALRYDFSWKFPGQYYLNVYDYIRDK